MRCLWRPVSGPAWVSWQASCLWRCPSCRWPSPLPAASALAHASPRPIKVSPSVYRCHCLKHATAAMLAARTAMRIGLFSQMYVFAPCIQYMFSESMDQCGDAKWSHKSVSAHGWQFSWLLALVLALALLLAGQQADLASAFIFCITTNHVICHPGSVWLPAVAQAFLPGCLHSFLFPAPPHILPLCFTTSSQFHCVVYQLLGKGEGQQAQTGDMGLELDLADASASSASAPGAGPPKDGAPALAIAGRHSA